MKTHAQQLPIELWLFIFTYIEIQDLFRAFFNLNNYFNELLNSKHLLLHVDFESILKNNFHWSDSIVNRLTCIQSSSINNSHHLIGFLQNYLEKLLHLKSSIVQLPLECIPYVSNALRQLLSLEYISLTCIPTQALLETILTVPTIRVCRLRLWRPRDSIVYHSVANSNIEVLHIKLLDDPNHSILYLLLSHTPKLRYLEIEKTQSISLFNQNLFILKHLEVLKFIWNHNYYKSDYFEQCRRVIPCLRSFYLTVHYFQFDETFNNNLIQFLWTLIMKMKRMKIFIICNQLVKPNENNTENQFNSYCRKLASRFHSQSDIVLRIKWTQEKASKQTIRIISQ